MGAASPVNPAPDSSAKEATGTCLSHLTLHHLSPQAATTCSQDRHCTHGLFCDKHFRLCLPLRQEGQYCRRDTHCARGLSCMFGKCHRPVLDGQEGKAWRGAAFRARVTLIPSLGFRRGRGGGAPTGQRLSTRPAWAPGVKAEQPPSCCNLHLATGRQRLAIGQGAPATPPPPRASPRRRGKAQLWGGSSSCTQRSGVSVGGWSRLQRRRPLHPQEGRDWVLCWVGRRATRETGCGVPEGGGETDEAPS